MTTNEALPCWGTRRVRPRSAPGRGAARTAVVFLLLAAAPRLVLAGTIIEWDFTRGTLGWRGNPRVEQLTSSPQGLFVKSTGEDPWIEGPAVQMPDGGMTRVSIRMRSTADGHGQLFYGKVFSERQSQRFSVRADGKWHDYSLVIRERLEGPVRFRLDPAAGAGELTIRSIRLEALPEITPPSLDVPGPPARRGRPVTVKSGPVEFVQYRGNWGDFVVRADGVEMAAGCGAELIGILVDEDPQWLSLDAAEVRVEAFPAEALVCTAVLKDGRGATWRLRRRVEGGTSGALTVRVQVQVDKDTGVVHLPWLSLFAGLGTFGPGKSQGLFAGLEYLCDEPSSSTADIAAPANLRRVPDPLKITFPLMAVSGGGHYIGLIWEPGEMVAAAFDSPDRLYGSEAHLMALSAPAVGDLRFENAFCAHAPFRLEAGRPLATTATVIAGKGRTVVPAVEQYLRLNPLPDIPRFEGGFEGAVELLAHGWLDSKINEAGLFRHAVWGEKFGAQPAADAAMYIDSLAGLTVDRGLRARLDTLKARALSRIPPGQPFSSSIGHAHQVTAPFVFGRLAEFVRQRRDSALRQLGRFDPNGILHYKPGQTDYARTHFADHANGLGGRVVAEILEAAALSADARLVAEGLDLLDKQAALYAGTVPRGAQTWEVPLHTPDILASAHMVKAYTLGYLLSGRSEHLEQARYWAWTGVPFVYLRRPVPGRVGPYATIAVLGATNWRAPVWFGRPVQWCGLVYASALHLLSEADPAGPWRQIARGITAAGLQMTWPASDAERVGLLPDFFELRPQVAAGPAINPGTVQAHLLELFARGKTYDMKKLPASKGFVHAPCRVRGLEERDGRIWMMLDGWPRGEYRVLVCGIEKRPGQVLSARARAEVIRWVPAQSEFHPEINALVITLTGAAEVQIRR